MKKVISILVLSAALFISNTHAMEHEASAAVAALATAHPILTKTEWPWKKVATAVGIFSAGAVAGAAIHKYYTSGQKEAVTGTETVERLEKSFASVQKSVEALKRTARAELQHRVHGMSVDSVRERASDRRMQRVEKLATKVADDTEDLVRAADLIQNEQVALQSQVKGVSSQVEQVREAQRKKPRELEPKALIQGLAQGSIHVGSQDAQPLIVINPD